jgi:hypothetical protein
MKKRIPLLLSLILIETLGLAAGIQASKGNWNYHSLLEERKTLDGTQVSQSGPPATRGVSSPRFPGGQQTGAQSMPIILSLSTGRY